MKSRSYNLWCYGLMILFITVMVLGVSIKAYASEPEIRYENGRPIVSYNEIGNRVYRSDVWGYLSGYYPYNAYGDTGYSELDAYPLIEDKEHYRDYRIADGVIYFDDFKITQDGKWMYSGSWQPDQEPFYEFYFANPNIWSGCTNEPDCNYGIRIWRYMDNEEEVVVPSYIEGQPVTSVQILIRPYLPDTLIPETEKWEVINGTYVRPNQYSDNSSMSVDTKCKRIILPDTVREVVSWGEIPRLEFIDYGTTPKRLYNHVDLSWNRFSGETTFFEDGSPHILSRPNTLDQFGGTIPAGSTLYR